MRAKRHWSLWICGALLMMVAYSVSPAPLSAAKRTVKKSSKRTAGGKATLKRTSQAASGKKAAPAKRQSSAKTSASARSKTPARSTWRTIQTSPSRVRIIEIQQALAEKGYFDGAATGDWGSSSIEALKRFQQDQLLEPTGRINALTLIALGLGPKREGPLSSALGANPPGIQEPASEDVPR
jgi:peptidoglycan hydrolase-like protein with peptidoglycan-binding domain